MFKEINLTSNFELLKIQDKSNLWSSKETYYKYFGYGEENIVFPIQSSNKACVIYAHYDSNNIIADYVISGIKDSVAYEKFSETLKVAVREFIDDINNDKSIGMSLHQPDNNYEFVIIS